MKNISCSLGRCNFVTLLVILLSFLVLSLPVQSCRLNQNVLAQAVSMNQRGQSETNRLNLPDREVADKPSFKSSIPQSAIQNLSSTSIVDPKSKAEVVRKTAKLQMPFIANEGQTDEKVAFYANTFGGTVFVTKDGDIVYSLSNNSSDVETQCLASLMHSPKGIQDNHVSDIMHPASWIVDHDKSEFQNPKSTSSNSKNQKSGVALREQFVGGKVSEVKGEKKSVTKVNYFKGNDSSKWKSNISTYDIVNLGEIYKGIDLKLKAYGNNVEKLFCVKPEANPEQIKIRLSGAKDCGVRNAEITHPLVPSREGINPKSEFRNPKLWVNEHGELEVETELGPVKFTKPLAYQEIDGKRVDVSVEYRIQNPEERIQKSENVGWVKRSAPNKKGEGKDGFASLNPSYTSYTNSEQIGKRLIGRREKGMGRRGAYLSSNFQSPTSNPKSAIQDFVAEVSNPKSKIANRKLEYGFTVASYDKTKDLIIDPLLASTFLGGSYSSDVCRSLTLDTSGNVYVTGYTYSSNFPATSGAYDTSSNGNEDVFVSKLDSGLTSLLASTYLGGSDNEVGYSLTLDTSGNIYVTGRTSSSDFPTTSGAYDTSGSGDIFVSKFNSDLTSLLASTFLGGSGTGYSIALDISGNVYVTGGGSAPTTSGAYSSSGSIFVSKFNSELTSMLASTLLGGWGYGCSLVLDTSGNVYVTGYTNSTDFPTTSGAYDTSYNSGYNDVFVSKLDSELMSLLASTYLGGSGSDISYSIAIDTGGNVYVTGRTSSSDFPTTSGAYDTSNNGGSENVDIFVSKLDGGLANLLASTYLGGSSNDYGYFLTLDTSGNVFVTGATPSSDFPTTSSAFDTSLNGGGYHSDVFVSKLDSGLTSLLASTFLGGSAYGYSLVLDTSGNVYVTGYNTASSDFPTTSGAYDTSGGYDGFVSKLDSNLSASPPTVTTGNAANVSLTSATLNGTVNANGQSTTVWFQYDTVSGSYINTSSTQTVTGTSDTTVSTSVSGLSLGTTYYYRIAAQNSGGTVYGSEMSFTTLSDTEAPTGSISINNNAAYTNSHTSTLSLSSTDNLGITGYYLSTSSSAPSASDTGWTSVTSTNSYSSNVSYTLSSGDGNKTVYVWFKDNSGNVSSSASDSIVLDTTAPVITITSPTSNSTYTVTSSVIAIGGTASDSTSGISSVTWSNDKGGSGTASGTNSWLTSSISLLSGDNVITVTAKDGTGNSGTDTLQVTYSPSGTVTAPSASTGSATNVTSSTAILNGTGNANGASTTVWFQYGTTSGSYGNTSSSQVVSGSSNTNVSISISGLSSNTTYYYRIVASNSAGTSYGSEASFATKTVSTTPTPTISPAPTLLPVPTPEVSPTPVPTLPPLPTPIPTLTTEPNKKGTVSGYIINKKGYPIESAKIRLKKANSKVFKKTFSDADGFFEFEDLDADTYIITAIKNGYKRVKQTVTLEEGEDVDIEIEMKKTRKKFKSIQ